VGSGASVGRDSVLAKGDFDVRLLLASGCLGARPRVWGAYLGCLLWMAGVPALAEHIMPLDPNVQYPEGPLWRDGKLLYVEYAASNIKSWDGKRSTLYWHKDGCGASALIVFNDHLLVACYDANALVELDGAGKQVREIRADSTGRPFIGPNDFTTDGHGGIYFTASGSYDIKAPITGTVVHLKADGRTITEVANTVHYPNGLTLAKDQQHLLVAEMLAGRILSFPIVADGALGSRTVWARLQDLAPPTPHEDAYNGPDGLKLGPDGHYYIAQNGSGRVLVVAEDKKLVRTIEVPTPYVTNMAFGPDGAGMVFVTGAFEQWKPPFPGVVYLWTQ
jgi:gluconolactonase